MDDVQQQIQDLHDKIDSLSDPRSIADTPAAIIKPWHLVAGSNPKGSLYTSDGTNFSKLIPGVSGSLLTISSGIPAYLSPGTSTQVLTISGGIPTWVTPATPSVSGKLQSIQTTSTLTNSSTSSTTDVAMLTITFTPTAVADMIITGSFIWQQSNAAGQNYADIQLDTAVQGNNPLVQTDFTANGKYVTQSLQGSLSNISAASHTIGIYYRVQSGATTATILSGNLTIAVYNH